MRSTPIILDRLDAALKLQGVALKRSQLLETAASAYGYHNSHELAAADKRGDLAPHRANVIGMASIGGVPLIGLRDGSGAIYAIEESFVEGSVEDERRERFGPSPYGGLVDLTDVAGHPATAWASPAAAVQNGGDDEGFLAFAGDDAPLGAHADLETAKEATKKEGGQYDIDAYVVDVAASIVYRSREYWRGTPIAGIGASHAERAAAAARALIAHEDAAEALRQMEGELHLNSPDWRMWEKDLKKAARHGREPIDDEMLLRFRHAVADNHSKSSEGERATVRYRESRMVERHLGGLLARLDQAEDALREAGLAPAGTERRSKEDAAEILAAIEATTSQRSGTDMPGLFTVRATRDGETLKETFKIEAGENEEARAAEIVAKAFKMDLADFSDTYPLESECDTFSVERETYPEAAAIIGDALSELCTSLQYPYGLPTAHPARIKLLAALDAIRPKPTV